MTIGKRAAKTGKYYQVKYLKTHCSLRSLAGTFDVYNHGAVQLIQNYQVFLNPVCLHQPAFAVLQFFHQFGCNTRLVSILVTLGELELETVIPIEYIVRRYSRLVVLQTEILLCDLSDCQPFQVILKS